MTRERVVETIADYAHSTSSRNLRRLVGDHDRRELARSFLGLQLDVRFAKLYCSKSSNVVLMDILRTDGVTTGSRGQPVLSFESQPFVKSTRTKVVVKLFQDGTRWFPIVYNNPTAADTGTTRPRADDVRPPPPKRLRPSARQRGVDIGTHTEAVTPVAASAPADPAAPNPGMAPREERADAPSAPQWPRQPGDDLETPHWALGCVSPVVNATPSTRVYDPFYSAGHVTRGWARLGIQCLHENKDFFNEATRPNLSTGSGYLLVTQPPRSLLDQLFKGDLKTIPRWAVLVPLTFLHTKTTLLNSVGHVSIIHILKSVDLSMNGKTVSRIRMSWVIKGIQLPHQQMYTTQGFGYWPLGQSRVYDRQQLVHAVRSSWTGEKSDEKTQAELVAVATTADDLKSLEGELRQLVKSSQECLDKDSSATSPWFAAVASKLKDAHSKPHLPVRLLRDAIGTLAKIVSEHESEADAIAAVCSSIALGKSVNLFPDILGVLPKLFTWPRHRELCVKLCLHILLNEYATRKAIRRCRGAMSAFLNTDKTLTLDSVVAELVNRLKSLATTPRKVLDIISTWIDPYDDIHTVPGVSRVDLEHIRACLLQPEDPAMGSRVWGPLHPRDNSGALGPHEIVSWNIDGIRSNGVMGNIVDLLRTRKPRLMMLWEVKCDATSLHAHNQDWRGQLSRAGYDYVYHYWCTIPRQGTGYSGCIIISRDEPASVQPGIGVPRLDKEARFVTVRYDHLTVIGSYSPCCSPSREGLSKRRVEFEGKLRSHLKAERSRQPRTICIGDLNVVPELHDADTSDMKEERKTVTLMCQALEREHYKTTMRALGLVDAYRLKHPQPHATDYTWHRRTKTRDFPKASRIDLCNVPREMSPQVLACDALGYGGSDHRPLSIVLKTHVDDTDPAADLADFASGVGEHSNCVDLTTRAPSTARTSGVEEIGTEAQCAPAPTERCDGAVDSQGQAHPTHTAGTSGVEENQEPWDVPTPDDQRMEPPTPQDYGDSLSQVMQGCATAVHEHAERVRVQWDNTSEECIEPANAVTDLGHTSRKLERFLNKVGQTVQSVLPVVNHRFGEDGDTVNCLYDTGACSSMMSKACATRLGLTFLETEGREPTFKYAGGQLGTPAGLVYSSWRLPEGRKDEDYFWVVDGMPYDVIFGSTYFSQRGIDIRYRQGGDKQIVLSNLSDGRGPCYLDFTTTVRDVPVEAAVKLYATEDVIVKPGHHIVVPVAPSKRDKNAANGTWGTVWHNQLNVNVVTARGCTTLCRGSNWVQVGNMKPTPTLVKRGSCVAYFLPQHKDAYHHVDHDIDVEERIHRRLKKDRETIASVAAAACTCDRDICESCVLKKAQEPACSSEESKQPDFSADTPANDVFAEAPLKGVTLGPRLDEPESRELKKRLLKAMWDKRHLWTKPDFTGKGPPHNVRCRIDLTDTFTHRGRPRSVSPQVREEIKKQVDEQRRMGIIEPSTSPYASTILLVPKADGTSRFCINYKPLNAITKKDGYLMPRVDESLASLRGSKYFSSMDLASAFWQIPMSEESKDLTTFVEPGGTWRYRNMPFGLINGPATFSRFIDEVLAGLKWRTCLIYMDDVLVHTPTLEEHVEALEEIFRRIDEYGLRFKPKKCFICVDQVQFLGHMVGTEGISADPDKVKAIKEMPFPPDKDKMKSALGLFAYYRKFVKSFASIAQPIQEELRRDAPLPKDDNGSVVWSEPVKKAFETLREKLVTTPILAHPDWSRPFEVHTDACKSGLGAVLVQKDENKKERVISYASRSLTQAESKYNVHEWECLAVLWATSLWYSMYLYGKKFKVVTDNDAIKWLLKSDNHTSSRLQKWVISMQDLDFDTVHRKGKSHGNADGLSRNSLPSTQPYGVDPPEPLTGVKPPVQCYVQESLGPTNPFKCDTCSTPASESCCVASTIREFREHGRSTHHRAVTTFNLVEECALTASYFPAGDSQAWSVQEWSKLQSVDEFCSPILRALAKDDSDRDDGERRATQNFTLEKGLLMRRVHSRSQAVTDRHDDMPDLSCGSLPHNAESARVRRRSDANQLVLVVPDSLKAFVLWRHHGLPLSGHNGRKRVYAALSSKFWWKGMYDSVRRWVRGCTLCSKRKLSRPRRAGTPKMILSGYPFHIVSIDLVGPMPETSSGNKYVLTMQDCFTRWPIAVPVPNTDAETISHALFRNLLTVYGCPTKILSDQGSNLIAEAVQAVCRKWNIRKIQTTGYQPQSVPVERFHRYLNHSMTMLHGSFGMMWDAYIDAAVFAYRVSVNETTGYSPYRLLYLRDPPMPDDLLWGTITETYDNPKEMVDKTTAQMVKAYKHAYDRQLAKAEGNAMLRAERSIQTTFFPGQLVFYYQENQLVDQQRSSDDKEEQVREQPQRVPNRWRCQWTGPHRVIKRLEGKKTNLYMIRHNVSAKAIEANVNRLSLHVPWDDDHECTGLDPFAEDHAGVKNWSTVGQAKIGTLIVFNLSDEDFPFGVGKLLGREETGKLRFQWLWNTTNNVKGVFRLGWEHKDPEDVHILYKDRLTEKEQERYDPYVSSEDPVYDGDVLAHGFKLRADGRLPLAIMRLLSGHPDVRWEMEPSSN